MLPLANFLIVLINILAQVVSPCQDLSFKLSFMKIHRAVQKICLFKIMTLSLINSLRSQDSILQPCGPRSYIQPRRHHDIDG